VVSGSCATSRGCPSSTPLGRGDARRALGHRRDRRQRDPHARRDHPGGRRRRHRLRDDGGAHELTRATSRRLAEGRARGDRARRAARPHRTTAAERPRRVGDLPGRRATRGSELAPASSASREAPQARPRRQRRSRTSARSARGTTSSRSASTRATACGSCCTRARAASGTASARTSSSSREEDMSAGSEPARRDLAYLPEGTRTSTTTSRPCRGRRTSRARTAS
jgi:hypothetical protein